MLKRNFCATMVAAAVVMAPVQRAQANDAAALLGGLIIGGAIASEVHKNKQRRTQRTYSNSAAYSAQRQQNRQVQTALNYFGYNVGTVDGSIGPRSRAAVLLRRSPGVRDPALQEERATLPWAWPRA